MCIRDSISLSYSDAYNASFSFTTVNPLQTAAQYAEDWSTSNQMLLNASKSVSIHCTRQKSIQAPSLEIGGNAIDEQTSVKLLGVIYDSRLKFSDHVTGVIERCKAPFHAIVMLKKAGVSTEGLVAFYKARVISIISYAAPSWYPLHQRPR